LFFYSLIKFHSKIKKEINQKPIKVKIFLAKSENIFLPKGIQFYPSIQRLTAQGLVINIPIQQKTRFPGASSLNKLLNLKF